MSHGDIMRRHPAIFGKPKRAAYGKCPICDLPLVKEHYCGMTDYYWICCPTHEAGHTSYLASDYDD